MAACLVCVFVWPGYWCATGRVFIWQYACKVVYACTRKCELFLRGVYVRAVRECGAHVSARVLHEVVLRQCFDCGIQNDDIMTLPWHDIATTVNRPSETPL